MSVEGLCEICETETVEDRCERCGKLVCDQHFEADQHVCVQCAAELGDQDFEPPGVDDSSEDVDTYEL